MNEHFTPDPDPLGDLLGPPAVAEKDGRLQDELRRRTCRVLRWRRRGRRLAWAAALAACYAAGMGTQHWRTPTAPPAPAVPEVAAKPDAPPPAPSERSAVALEWQAFDSTEGRAELYRRAGDEYIASESDPESALRCYGASLDAGSAADRVVSAADNWLLMAIKNARAKESRYAKNVD
jgi:hypothetical protein